MDRPTEFVITTKPYRHQVEALSQAWGNTGFAYFLEQGTGKSKIIIDEMINLIELGLINCVVVLAPNNVHVNWKTELIKHAPKGYDKWAIQIWRSNDNLTRKEEETRAILNSGKVLVFLMNIEALSHNSGFDYLKRILLARRRVYMVIDESHKIKTPGALRTRRTIELGKLVWIKRISTGTEAEEGLHHLYSQFRFLNPNIIGLKSYTSFKSMYCTMGGYENREITGYQNQEILATKIAPYIYQKRKAECLDLPDKVYVTHEIDLTKEQWATYRQLEDELLYELKEGVLIDVTLAITRIMRLQQVLCGHINDSHDARNVQIIPSNRASYVSEIIEEASSKVLVYCRFIMDVELVVTELARNGIRAIGISSRVEGHNRMLEIDRWRQDKDTKALVMTIGTGGTGLTLNEANTTIFYSNVWSGTDRIQAEDRNHRIGQHDKVTYHDIIVPGHIDHRILIDLRMKKLKSAEFRNTIDLYRFLTETL